MAVINNSINNTTIGGTASNDTITNTGANVTIENSAGNDLINLDGSNQVFAFMNGSSSNTVNGFDEDDTVYVLQVDWASTDF